MAQAFSPSSEGMPHEFLVECEQDDELGDFRSGRTSTSTLRAVWSEWLCNRGSGSFANPTFFGKHIGGVPDSAVDAFSALEQALRSSGYSPASAWAYNCRSIDGTDKYSLHSYGIAIDLDPVENPYTSGDPYSGKIKPHHVNAVLAIKSAGRRSIWSWGGNWRKPDRMHFQLDQGPNEIDVDWATVPGGGSTTGPAVHDETTTEEETMLTRGAKGVAVERFQTLLQHWNPDALPDSGPDGKYGDETIEWVEKYQEAMGLPVTGNIDGLTAAMLLAPSD